MSTRVPLSLCLLALVAVIAPACSDDSGALIDATTTAAAEPQVSTTATVVTEDADDTRADEPTDSTANAPGRGGPRIVDIDGPLGGTVTTAAPGTASGAGTAPSGTATGGTAAAPGAPATPGSATTVVPPPENRWALSYTGGVPGPATGVPLRVGYVNQEDFFPEASTGLEAAVTLLNEELGGAAGRPIEVVECRIATPADGARCGQQFANDPTVAAVVTGTMLFGNKALYDALAGIKPVLIGNGVTTDDFTTPAGLSYTLGSVTVLPALPLFATRYLRPTPTSAAILVPDSPAQRGAVEFIVQPILERAGVATSIVSIPTGASSTDVATALTAAGADTAEVFLAVSTVQDCVAIDGAIRELGIDPVVVTTGLCAAPPMSAHLAELGETGPVPDGWYVVGNGYNVFAPDEASGTRTYIAALRDHAARVAAQDDPTATTTTVPVAPEPLSTPPDFTGYSAPVFANVLTLAKFANRLGPDGITPEAIDAQMRAYRGPMMMQAGVLRCGVEPYIAVCGHYAGVQRYADGRWASVADATNNRAIDVRATA